MTWFILHMAVLVKRTQYFYREYMNVYSYRWQYLAYRNLFCPLNHFCLLSFSPKHLFLPYWEEFYGTRTLPWLSVTDFKPVVNHFYSAVFIYFFLFRDWLLWKIKYISTLNITMQWLFYFKIHWVLLLIYFWGTKRKWMHFKNNLGTWTNNFKYLPSIPIKSDIQNCLLLSFLVLEALETMKMQDGWENERKR